MAKVSRLNEQFAGNEAFEAARRRAQSNIRIGTELRRMREGMGLTQEAVAARAGLDQSDISKIEAGVWGKRGISFETLDRVLPVFGLRVVHGISPLPGAKLNKDEQARALAINELMQL
jgi:transcriptional regulator with XRE-family HTH domain